MQQNQKSLSLTVQLLISEGCPDSSTYTNITLSSRD